MNLPTKEELKSEKESFELPPDYVMGGEIEGIMSFARTMKENVRLSDADETFICYLIYSSYPYELSDLIFFWEEVVSRSDYQIPEKEAKYKALAWFDRRIGKLIRIGALNCSMDTSYFESLKKSFKFESLIGMIKEKYHLTEAKP